MHKCTQQKSLPLDPKTTPILTHKHVTYSSAVKLWLLTNMEKIWLGIVHYCQWQSSLMWCDCCVYAAVWAKLKNEWKQESKGLTAKGCSCRLVLSGPLSGWLPCSVHQPLPLLLLLLHWDIKLIVDARVLLVENDLQRERTKNTQSCELQQSIVLYSTLNTVH